MDSTLTEQQWQQYERDGYLKLGKLLGDDELKQLQHENAAVQALAEPAA